MDVLKFTLSGRTAFFKKPDVNSYYYFTYGNIHKVALLGILGAIMGFEGYNQKAMGETYKEVYEECNTKIETGPYPEFYEKLRNIKVAIVPENEKGYIEKKIQVFNNSVGYASHEKGGNLIVKEQWLENPKWSIYLLVQGKIEEEIANRLSSFSFKYLPYLGKNDHVANIDNVEIIRTVERVENVDKIHSLYIEDYFQLNVCEEDNIFDSVDDYESIWKYEELLPVALEENTNKYEFERFIFTNSSLSTKKEALVYNCDGKFIFFF
ncbi:CRISPR-associated protein Cas5h [Clostridium punense]|uniref:CRISPR-associated protein Cas5h n=1 Tax=Clostridium punense TaxID=1054297 RepID=A0ABS4K736_9CLOT|nr:MULTISPECIES: type I-B CRISPR-associated protein Cas5b [Clostridium]EQB88079.1 hypothetical protein M918_05940 [Clostridium sp. BL8]MBP2022936.1 CRISPR-associated protein Cas5h [Clostridium punense]